MWNKNKKEKLVGETKYLVLSTHTGMIFGDLFNTPEEAMKRKLRSMFFENNSVVVEVQITRTIEGHVCFCKQTHCCCAPK